MDIKIMLLLSLFSLVIVTSCKKSETPDQLPTQNQQLIITGRAIDCIGANVKEGMAAVVLSNGQLHYTPITNGSFDLTVSAQGPVNTIKVCATDYNALKYSDTARITVNGDHIDVGIINSCISTVGEYFRYKIDTTNYVFVPRVLDSISVTSWNYTGGEPVTSFDRVCHYSNCGYQFQMQFDGHSVGSFPVTGRCRLFVRRYYSFNMPNAGSITYNSYGNVGEYVTGTLYVPFVDNTDSLNHLMTGNFKLRRTR